MSNIEALLTQLREPNLSVQIAAAEALANREAKAQPAIVELVRNCGTTDEDLQNWCFAALEKIGPPTIEQIDELALLANSANTDVAFWATTLLGRAGTMALTAVSVLAARSTDASAPEVQKRAVWALERIQAA